MTDDLLHLQMQCLYSAAVLRFIGVSSNQEKNTKMLGIVLFRPVIQNPVGVVPIVLNLA